ncbi:uncharacterized protein NECHADRAFT_88688 [Fusarium vanettenii 77-13-4]|uniref:Uncharacterized protein n=1 Tax=Fusarium vanettenii (strain ATCC MYA-4622 / CBS 123669 / FGSC 9596 / NRRL 45880 / 77-13-4) TaxID=660122 RepID=C7ZLI6_FUSV7|nr:uncharacterized protein NECHADRAFT_88688 [Fusarium vanettenii 77-13-4]EEU35143.1 predicted protein [Fusarium vanettenii 77-13-4]
MSVSDCLICPSPRVSWWHDAATIYSLTSLLLDTFFHLLVMSYQMQAQRDQNSKAAPPTGSTTSSTHRVRAILEDGRDASQLSPKSRQYLLNWEKRHRAKTVSDLSQVPTEDIRSTASQMEPELVSRKEQQLLDEIEANPEMQASFLLFKQTSGQNGKVQPEHAAASSHRQVGQAHDRGQALRAQQLKDANDHDIRQMEEALEQRVQHFKQALAWDIEVHRLNAKIQSRRLEAVAARESQ